MVRHSDPQRTGSPCRRTWSYFVFQNMQSTHFLPKKAYTHTKDATHSPYPGLPLPTCSWTILLWASVQDPRPRSRSCSRKFNLNRQRCRLSCSASSTSSPESECWRVREPKSVPVAAHYPYSQVGCCLMGVSLKPCPSPDKILRLLPPGSPLPQGWRHLI